LTRLVAAGVDLVMSPAARLVRQGIGWMGGSRTPSLGASAGNYGRSSQPFEPLLDDGHLVTHSQPAANSLNAYGYKPAGRALTLSAGCR